MRKNKLGRQKKFLMLISVLSMAFLLSTSIAGAAVFSSAADSTVSGSAELSDTSRSLISDSASTAADSSSDDSITTSGSSISSDKKDSSPSQQSNNKAPVADFFFEKELDGTNSYIFDGTASYDPDGIIVSYYWAYSTGSSFPIVFGDRSICKYTLNKPGNYLISLKVTDNDGATDVMNKVLVISGESSSPSSGSEGLDAQPIPPDNKAPVAIFDYAPSNPKVNQIITFDATASYDTDGTIERYDWFYEKADEPGAWYDIVCCSKKWVKINYSFDEVGNYTIILCVVDNKGLSDDDISYCYQTIEVRELIPTSANGTSISGVSGNLSLEPINKPPVAIFSYTPESPRVNQIITFDATASYDPDGTIEDYDWYWANPDEMGGWYPLMDGNDSFLEGPVIEYAFTENDPHYGAGNYTIILAVVDNKGLNDENISDDYQTIVVRDATPTSLNSDDNTNAETESQQQITSIISKMINPSQKMIDLITMRQNLLFRLRHSV